MRSKGTYEKSSIVCVGRFAQEHVGLNTDKSGNTIMTETCFVKKDAVWTFENVTVAGTKGTKLFQTLMLVFAILFAFANHSCSPARIEKQRTDSLQTTSEIVPVGGNTWASAANEPGGAVDTSGIINWSDKSISFTTYVRLAKSGTLKLWLRGVVPEGQSHLQVGIAGKQKTVDLSGTAAADFYVGEWMIKDTGYTAIHLQGLTKTGSYFATISAITLSGTAIDTRTAFVKNNEGAFFYWGRRGPSVHLNYDVPESINAEWYYNEVTVPQANDVVGSYFMAVGFADGYFGMQVNSPSERRILFSVWSPFETDDPATIPADQKINLMKKGPDVYTGEFGNEGSGGQSFLRYNWKAGTTYSFLLHGVPGDSAHTFYTAYFFAPEQGQWLLLASFRRPKAGGYLKRFHSFLENFEPETGPTERKVLFNNQWVCDNQGSWTEISTARFTGDNTAVKQYRLDYSGGTANGSFYLRNCGFFIDYTPLRSLFTRPLHGKKPVVDFNSLP